MADNIHDWMEGFLTEDREEKNRKRREYFKRLSSEEKIEQLMKYIEKLEGDIERIRDFSFGLRIRLLHIEDYLQEVAQVPEQRLNILFSPKDEIVSTEKISCKANNGQIHTAILLFHRDGRTTVKCIAQCDDCKWGSAEL